jgi:hypothetical protein
MTLSAGTLYGFSAYSKDLVAALQHTGDLDILGSFGDAGLYAGITMGILTDKCGAIATLFVSAALTFVGYFTVWLAVDGHVHLDIWVLAVAFFLAGQGSFGFYFTSVHLNGDLVSSEYRAAVYGFVLMLFGFSSLVYLSIYTAVLNSDISSFFLLLAISLPATGLLTAFGQFMVHVCGTPPPPAGATLYANGASAYENHSGSKPRMASVEEEEDLMVPSLEADIDFARPQLPGKGPSITGVQLLQSSLFWWLFIYFVTMTGPGLMWKNKIGTIIETFHGSDTSTMVKSWSVINSVSRVLFGLVAATIGRWGIPKSSILIFAAAIMGGSHLMYAIMAFADHPDLPGVPLWIANVCTAIAYGCQFTVVTSLVPTYFGTEGLGMNLGVITIAPMIGGTALTAVVNALSEDHYASGFLCSASCVGVALVCSLVLTRHDVRESRCEAYEEL